MILDKIVEDKKKRLKQQKQNVSLKEMKEKAVSCQRISYSFYEALAKKGLSIIGEFKKASPSMGVIQNKLELTDRIDQYNQSVDAISCLTEEDHFYGSIDYFKQIRSISSLPMIRKDFIIEEYQIYEAKIIGADAILLIAAILDDDSMKRFYQLAKQLGMDSLVEVHDEEELRRAIWLEADIIGVNNRNLKDFTINLQQAKHLVSIWKEEVKKSLTAKHPIFVSESGVTTKEDILFLKECQIDALLIGRAFMESEQPQQLAREWKGLYENK